MEIYLGMEAAVKPASPREAGMLRVMAVTMNNAAARMRGSGDPGAEAGNGWLSRCGPGHFGGGSDGDWSVKEGLQGTGVSLYFCITGLA